MLVCPKCGSIYTREVDHCGLDGERLVATNADPLIGRTIDRYRIEENIGAGGMARVYRAAHTTLEHDIALKVLHGEFAADKDLARRFHREAKALSRIKHENVVNVSDFGATKEGLLFMVMEYLDGPTLSRALRDEGPMPPKRAARIVRDICKGLAAAHARGYVHRDLKPGNVVLVERDGRELAKILDFGLVRIIEPDGETVALTQQGMFFGTPAYMSPEQIRGEEAGPRADLYALGVMLYQMLTGNPPFQGELKQLAQQHLHELPPVPPLPYGGLTEIALDCLAKEPSRRPASANEIIARIDELTIAPEPPTRKSRRPGRAPRSAPDETPTRAERSALSRPILEEERPPPRSEDPEDMDPSIRAALGVRAYIGGWVPLLAFFLVTGALAYYFWSGGRLPPAIAKHFEAPSIEASTDPAGALSPPAPAPEEADEAPAPAAPKEARPAPKPNPKRPARPKARAPEPSAPKREPPEPEPAPPKPAPAEPPVETVEATDYETAEAPPDPNAPEPKSFSELDMNLGWALNQKGLAWADLSAVAPDAARQWARWYKRTSEPEQKVLDETYGALMDAVDTVEVDAALLGKKLARARRVLRRLASHTGEPRYDALEGRFSSLERDLSFSPLRREPVSIAAEITLLETDLAVFEAEAKRAAAPPPEPEPETTPAIATSTAS